MKIMNMYVYIKTGKKCSVLKAAEWKIIEGQS